MAKQKLQKVRFSNQLTSTLKEYFPQVLEAFGSIDNKSTIQFLKVTDTFDQVKGTPRKKLEKFLDESGVNRKDSRERFYQAMKKPGYRVSSALAKAKVKLKNALVAHLELLQDSRSEEMEGNELAPQFHDLPVSSKASLEAEISQDEHTIQGDDEHAMAKLKTLRQLLFDEIMGDESPKAPGESSLKIAPKTLSEAIKALLDVDKRISEREGTQSVAMPDPYQSILARCAGMVEDE